MYKLLLPLRYLLKRPITYLAVTAVALCVFVALVVITVLSGLTSQFRGRIHNFVGDCVVSGRSLLGFDGYEEFIAILRDQPFVRAATPVIKTTAIVKARSSGATLSEAPREIIGIDPASHFDVTGLAAGLEWNRQSPQYAFVPQYAPELPGAMCSIGILFDRDQSGRYHLPPETPMVSFEITILPLTSRGTPAKAGTDLVNTKTFWLSDTVNSGLARVDWTTIYLPFEEAQILTGMNLGRPRTTAIHIRFVDGVENEAGRAKVAALWSDYLAQHSEPSDLMKQVRVQSWRLHQREMIAAVETEQKMMSMIFGLLGIITVFIVFVVFYMIVSHKSRDIGVLRSVGASTMDITSMFLCFGLLVGTVGSAIGTFAGWQFLVRINDIEALLMKHFEFQLWNRRIYAINEIPNSIYGEVLLVIVASAILASILGALVPSIQAARKRPTRSLSVNQL
ncbi:MAG TPA: FtsX-like permease family protein [Sedimentisphaerales bacterium]|nr:FtsX-like permease family protein [Sedimentisphaerales bacterium]